MWASSSHLCLSLFSTSEVSIVCSNSYQNHFIWRWKCLPWCEEMWLFTTNWCNTFCSNPFVIFWAFASIAEYTKPRPECLFLSEPIWSHLQTLSLLLADRTVLVGILWLRGCKRNMPKPSPSLLCCSARMSIHFMDPGDHLPRAHRIGTCRFSSLSNPGRELFWRAFMCPTLMHP